MFQQQNFYRLHHRLIFTEYSLKTKKFWQADLLLSETSRQYASKIPLGMKTKPRPAEFSYVNY